jgi:hypothetical protein
MNTTRIFQNSWNLMLRYRALWIFGVILALTTISFGSALWFRNNNNNNEDQSNRTLVNWEISPKDKAWIQENFGLDLPLRYTLTTEDLSVRLDDPSITPQERTRLLYIAAGVTAGLLILIGLALVLRYTADTALITLVNDQHMNDKTHRARQGWLYGFSIAALKLFLIDLVVYSLLFLLTMLIFIPAMLPVLIAISGTPVGIAAGILLMISLTLVCLAALLVMWVAGILTVKLAYRAVCLEGLGVFAAIWRGFRLMCTQLGGVGLTALVITGLDLVYPILAAPVFLLLAAVGVAVSGLLAGIVGVLLALVLVKGTAWTIAIVIGIVLLVLVIGAPLTLMDGLREVFKSSAWTLTFIEAAGQQSLERAPAPQPAAPQVGTA